MHICGKGEHICCLPKLRVATNLTAGRPTLLGSHCTCHYSLVPVQYQALAGSRAGGQTGLSQGTLHLCKGAQTTLTGPLEFRARPLGGQLQAQRGPGCGLHRGGCGRERSWGFEAWFLMRAWRHAYRASLVPGLGSGSGHGA